MLTYAFSLLGFSSLDFDVCFGLGQNSAVLSQLEVQPLIGGPDLDNLVTL